MSRMETRTWSRRIIDGSLLLMLASGLWQGYGPWLMERLRAG